jgi:hypothetical protein
MSEGFLFISESVTEGHPDKVAGHRKAGRRPHLLIFIRTGRVPALSHLTRPRDPRPGPVSSIL